MVPHSCHALSPEPSAHVFLDASGSFGCGALVDPVGYIQIEWPEGWDGTDISVKEMVPVVVAAAVWARPSPYGTPSVTKIREQ